MPRAGKVSRMQRKGQVTIPRDIREKLGLKEGDLVAFVETDAGVLITAQELVAMKTLDRIGELLREEGITLDELIESGREVRGRLTKERYGLTEEDNASVS